MSGRSARRTRRGRLAGMAGMAGMTGVALAVAVLGPAASAAPLPRADLAIGSNHVNHATASVGDLVRFTIIAVDKGPAPSNMDVAERLPGGLALVSETCDQGISADTPLCEYIEDPGVAVTTVVVARVLPSAHGRVLTPRACVMGEGGTFDPRRADNCLALTLTIRD